MFIKKSVFLKCIFNVSTKFKKFQNKTGIYRVSGEYRTSFLGTCLS